jgi:hypothetical protein
MARRRTIFNGWMTLERLPTILKQVRVALRCLRWLRVVQHRVQEADPIGALIGIGTAAIGGIVDARVQLNSAINDLNAASADEVKAVARLNALLMTGARLAPSLAGRPAGGSGGGNDDDCKKEWKDAADYCSELDDIPRNSPRWTRELKRVFGGNMMRCMRGQVSQRCGGSKVDW